MKYKYLLIFILFLSFSVRIVGVNFNLPYIEFTDELTVGRNGSFFAHTGNLRSFDFFYPPLHTYFQGAIIFLYSKLKGIAVNSISRGDLYLLLRTVVAILGSISVYFIYKITKRITKQELPAIFATAIFGFNLTHIAYSQLVKNEIPTLFLGLITMLLALKISEEGRRKWYFLSGFFCGLTFATAYLGIIFIIPILTSHFLSAWREKRNLVFLFFSSKLFLVFAGLFLGFVLANPIIIFDRRLFFNRLVLYQQAVKNFYSQPLDIPAWRWYLAYLWRFGLYYPIFLLAVGGIVVGLKQYWRQSLVLLSFLFVYGITIFVNNNYYSDRLSLSLIPFLIIFAGFSLAYLYNFFWKIVKKQRPRIFIRLILILIIISFFSLLFFRVGIVSYQMSQPSALRAVENWLDKNAARQSRVFLSARGGKIAFSPNSMEKKYKFFYYYPEIINRPPESLALFYDYIILYWSSLLPPEWGKDFLNNFSISKVFTPPSLPRKLKFINAYATISNPFCVARSGFQEAAVVRLPERPFSDYGIITNLNNQNGILYGEFIFIPGSKDGEENKFIFSTDFTLTSPNGDIKVTETLKDFKDSDFYKFILDTNTGDLKLNKTVRMGIIRDLKKTLVERLNSTTKLYGQILGQDGKDYCALGGQCHPSGVADYHLQLTGFKKEIKRLVVSSGKETWMSPFNGAYADVFFEEKDGLLDIYFEPWDKSNINTFDVILYYKDETLSLVKLKL